MMMMMQYPARKEWSRFILFFLLLLVVVVPTFRSQRRRQLLWEDDTIVVHNNNNNNNTSTTTSGSGGLIIVSGIGFAHAWIQQHQQHHHPTKVAAGTIFSSRWNHHLVTPKQQQRRCSIYQTRRTDHDFSNSCEREDNNDKVVVTSTTSILLEKVEKEEEQQSVTVIEDNTNIDDDSDDKSNDDEIIRTTTISTNNELKEMEENEIQALSPVQLGSILPTSSSSSSLPSTMLSSMVEESDATVSNLVMESTSTDTPTTHSSIATVTTVVDDNDVVNDVDNVFQQEQEERRRSRVDVHGRRKGRRRSFFSTSSSATSSSSSRAIQYINTTWNDLILPIGWALWDPNMAVPSNWDEFWNMPLHKNSNKNNNVITTGRSGMTTTTTTTTTPKVTSHLVENNVMDATTTTNSTIAVSITTTTTETTATTTNPVMTTVAEQFTSYLEHLGPTFVKFGQAISSRPDIVCRPLAVALTRLQDQMDTAQDGLDDVTVIANILENELWARQQQQNDDDDEDGISRTGTTTNISRYFPSQDDWDTFIGSLSSQPVAAASIGVVYSAILPLDNRKVAIKIQRPGIDKLVQQDSELLLWGAQLLESIPPVPSFLLRRQQQDGTQPPQNQQRLIRTDLSGAVKEFMGRIVEELNYDNEANNLEIFAKLYSHRRHHRHRDNNKYYLSGYNNGSSFSSGNNRRRNNKNNQDIQVVVPEVYRELCTDKVLVMEWIEGIKLVDLQRNNNNNDDHDPDIETLDLIKQGIDCTLSQLLETGILHADPHGGNLLKVMVDSHNNIGDDDDDSHTHPSANTKNNDVRQKTRYRLGYVDFGLLSTIPPSVQEGLICAVAQLVFAKNVTAVANLFGDLQLLPQHVLDDPTERDALAKELEQSLSQVLVYKTDDDDDNNVRPSSSTTTLAVVVPNLRFDKLLDVLSRLVPRFQFQLPPYFLNNARAMGTLEGMAKEVDPTFNILQILYPYAIRTILRNPSSSVVVDSTLNSLIENPTTGRLDPARLQQLLDSVSTLTGQSKTKILRDVVATKNGKKLVLRWIRECGTGSTSILRRFVMEPGKRRLDKMTRYLRL